MSLYLSTAGGGGGGGGGVNEVINSDGTLTINPTTGNVVASLNLANSDTWTAVQAINLNAASAPTPLTGTILQLTQADTVAARLEINAFGTAAFFTGIAFGGTNASPSALTSGTQIGGYNSWGYDGSAVIGPQASFRTYASQNWTAAHAGTYIDLATTANNTLTLAEVIRFENDGGITVPSTVTGGDKGAGTINAGGLYVNGTAVLTSGVTSFTGDGVFLSNSASTGAVTATLESIPAYTGFANATGSSAAPTSGVYGLYGISVTGTGVTLTASSPAFIVCTATTQSFYLPVASTCVGKMFIVVPCSTSGSYCNIYVQSPDSLYYGGAQTSTSFYTMNTGSGGCLVLATASGKWQLVFGPALMAGANNGFALAAGGVLYGTGSGYASVSSSLAGTSGQTLISGGASIPTWTSSPTVTHQISGGTAPTVAVGAGAGSGGSPAATIKAGDGSGAAHDTDFLVTLTTGTTVGTGVIFTVTFGTAYAVAPCVYVTPANAATAALVGGVTQWYPSSTTTTMVLNSGATGLTAAGAVYAFYVHCGQ